MTIELNVQKLIAVIADLTNSDYRIGAAAIDQLAQLGDPAAIPVLLDILRRRQFATIADDVQTGVLAWRAVCALGKLSSANLIPNLLAAASEEFSLLRGAVVVSLTEIALRTTDANALSLIIRGLNTFTSDVGIVSVFKRQRVCDLAVDRLKRIQADYPDQFPLI